jgi:carbonic anhydrase/acetyltransferase-like protein (isoleucine patch superfamily)
VLSQTPSLSNAYATPVPKTNPQAEEDPRMTSQVLKNGIRPNPLGDLPKIDPSAFVDPSAQIIGNVVIGPRVYVGPLSVIRADEIAETGKVTPVVVEEDACVQDGVIIHGRAGTQITIGARCNISHGAVVHGPATIKEDCFVAIRAVVYDAVLGESVWLGVGSIVMRSTVPANTWIPAGSVIRSDQETKQFRLVDLKELKYKQGVYDASAKLREGYLKLCGG